MAASLSFDTAYRQVKRGQLARVYYLTGDQDILKDELVDLIRNQAVEAASRDFNVDVRAAGDLDGETLNTLVETPPMLAERRLVIVKSLEQWRKNARVWQVLERYIASPSPTTVLVLVHAAGEKPNPMLVRHSCHVTLDALTPDRLARWVEKRASEVQLSLEPEAITYLLEAVGENASLLGVEIDKLAAALGDEERPVPATDVARLVGIRRGETPPAWVNAVLNRDIKRSVTMLDTVLSATAVSGVRLVALLGTALVGVALAQGLLAGGRSRRQVEGEILQHMKRARLYRIPNWQDEARKWVHAAEQWSRQDLTRAIRACYVADRALKSTTVSDERGTLTSMLFSMVTPQAA